jgi:glucoamylase
LPEDARLTSAAATALGGVACAETPTTWAYAAKTGVGASYEAYVDGAYKDGGPTGAVSKVWFSIADGTLTETMYGLIHEAQIKQLRVAVKTATGLAVEGADTTSKTEYLHLDAAGRPLSPAYKVTTTDKQGRFEIEKRIFTDPDRNALFVRVTVRALKGPVTPFLVLEPHMANTGGGDTGAASASALRAYEGKAFLSLKGARSFVKAVATPLGTDALSAVKARDPDRRRVGQGRDRPDRRAAAAGLGRGDLRPGHRLRRRRRGRRPGRFGHPEHRL